jgi:hypothetical protein
MAANGGKHQRCEPAAADISIGSDPNGIRRMLWFSPSFAWN